MTDGRETASGTNSVSIETTGMTGGDRLDRMDPRTRDRLAQQRQENYTFNENHRIVINDLAAMSMVDLRGEGRGIRSQP